MPVCVGLVGTKIGGFLKHWLISQKINVLTVNPINGTINRHFSLLNVNVAGACVYNFQCDGGRLVRAYLRR